MTAYRSIDGTGDNQNYNATATDMTRVGTAHFADGISESIEINPHDVDPNHAGATDGIAAITMNKSKGGGDGEGHI